MKALNFCILLCFCVFQITHSFRPRNNTSFSIQSEHEKALVQAQTQQANPGMDFAKAAKSCFNTILASVPPVFCWKKGGDFGIIPGCPSGYFKEGALCVQNCPDDRQYIPILPGLPGVCRIRSCKSGYQDRGATCYKWMLDWYFKNVYTPSTLTLFNGVCSDGYYLGGALCYRNCAKIGAVNCGIGACSSSSDECALNILNIILSIGLAVVQSVLLVLTMGASSGGTSAFAEVKGAIAKLGQQGMKLAFNSFKKWLAKKLTAEAIEDFAKAMAVKAKDYAINKLKEEGVSKISAQAFALVCKETAKSMLYDKQDTPSQDFSIKSLDFLGFADTDAVCKSAADDATKIDCAKRIMGYISLADPTGLVAVAAAFMHPECEGV